MVRGTWCVTVGRLRETCRGRRRRHQSSLRRSTSTIGRCCRSCATTTGPTASIVHHGVTRGAARRRSPEALGHTCSVGGVVMVVVAVTTHSICSIHARLRRGMRSSRHHNGRNYWVFYSSIVIGIDAHLIPLGLKRVPTVLHWS